MVHYTISHPVRRSWPDPVRRATREQEKKMFTTYGYLCNTVYRVRDGYSLHLEPRTQEKEPFGWWRDSVGIIIPFKIPLEGPPKLNGDEIISNLTTTTPVRVDIIGIEMKATTGLHGGVGMGYEMHLTAINLEAISELAAEMIGMIPRGESVPIKLKDWGR